MSLYQQKENLKQKGNDFFKQKKYAQALKRYKDAIEIGLNKELDKSCYALISKCWIQLKNYDKAKESIINSLKIDQNDQESNIIFLNILIHFKEFKLVKEHVSKLIIKNTRCKEFQDIYLIVEKEYIQPSILKNFDIKKVNDKYKDTLEDVEYSILKRVLDLIGSNIGVETDFNNIKENKHGISVWSIQNYIWNNLENVLEKILKNKIENPLIEKILRDWKNGFIRSSFYIQDFKTCTLFLDVKSKKLYSITGILQPVREMTRIPCEVYNCIILPFNLPDFSSKVILGSYFLEENLNFCSTFNAEKYLINLISKENQIIHKIET